MNVQIITSSYPATPDDPSGTAGLFVREFALELARLGHRVIVHPVARTEVYEADPGIIIEALPWKGGDRELASMSLGSPMSWLTIGHFMASGYRRVSAAHREFEIHRTLCMWVVPSGVLGCALALRKGVPFDVWALGSDIWRIRKIPLLGPRLLRTIIRRAERVFADGLGLREDVESISGRRCSFLPSSRRLPLPDATSPAAADRSRRTLLFVGRYHANKGPDILVEAIRALPERLRRVIRVEMRGFGPLRARLEAMIQDYRLESTIELGGPIEAQEFSNALERASFLVIPSRIESIPVVLSDALQRGRPVVTTPAGDLGRIVTGAGCGIVARRAGATELAAALIAALETDAARFAAGVASAAGRFDIAATVRRWLNPEAGDDEEREEATDSGSRRGPILATD